MAVSSRNPQKIFKINESYRHQGYVATISLDPSRNSWIWKGHVDFDAGIHSISSTRTFATAEQAKEHMRQSAHQCIDNRLG
jgi:hypothetical protein